MAIFLIFISLIQSIVFLLKFKKNDFYTAIIGGILINALLITISSELLSIFSCFNFSGILTFWLICILSFSILLYKNHEHLDSVKSKLKASFHTISQSKIYLLLLIIGILILLQGLLYPPNNWDSLTYHLGRIPHWVENKSIYAFPTHIYRQIYSPPLAELIAAQVCIIGKSDYFANSIQLLFAIGSIAAVVSISKEFSLSRRAIMIACIFLITTPEILLQGSSSQNDIVLSFFILSTILFAIKSYKNFTLLSALTTGIAAALAIYTKGTAYIYLLPILIIWGITTLLKYRSITILFKLSLTPFLILLINSGFYYRNHQLSGDILGKNEDRLFNEKIGLSEILLSVTKNIGNHFAVFPFSTITNKVVEKAHITLDIPIDDIHTNFNGIAFKLENWQHHEDTASNFFQIIIIFISIFLFLFQRKKYPTYLWLLVTLPIIEFFFFCVILKWQPWHTRLQIPIFFMSSLFVAVVLDQSFPINKKRSSLLKIGGLVLCIYAFSILILNPTRPFITNSYTTKTKINDGRFKKYCANYPKYEDDYKLARYYLKKYEGKTGVEIGGDMWEYLLYYDIFSTNQKMGIPINIQNLTKNIQTTNHNIACIISFKNARFYNLGNTQYKKTKGLKLFSIYTK